jgi:hypothetical protein
VRQIAEGCPESQIIINLSLDGVGEKHDFIRGVPGNFEKFERTLAALLDLRDSLPNLAIGIHSVISTFSVGHLDELIAYADQSGADQFITEIAEPRVELDTIGLPITPDRPRRTAAPLNQLMALAGERQGRGIARITQAFRVEYYKLVKRILEKKTRCCPAMPAGPAPRSMPMARSGRAACGPMTWATCAMWYDFSSIWFGETIKKARRSIAAKECHCPLANAAYTNMLHDMPTLARVGSQVLHPDQAPRLPLPGCERGRDCRCVYRPVMTYEAYLE